MKITIGKLKELVKESLNELGEPSNNWSGVPGGTTEKFRRTAEEIIGIKEENFDDPSQWVYWSRPYAIKVAQKHGIGTDVMSKTELFQLMSKYEDKVDAAQFLSDLGY